MIKITVHGYSTRNSKGIHFVVKPQKTMINKRFIISVDRITVDVPGESSRQLYRILLSEPIIEGWDVLFGENKELEEGFDS